MCGSFVMLNRSVEWDEKNSLPMSNVKPSHASQVENTLICVPTYGGAEDDDDDDDDDGGESDEDAKDNANGKARKKKMEIQMTHRWKSLRINLLESIKKSDVNLKHAKQKTKFHSVTNSRGFGLEKKLKQIRQMVNGDNENDAEYDNEETDWS
ncbi:hypothetical protein RFI_12159 [Reticulomyxa filosa]|uniref:Uncharacterized protein n=1 Tax=Reticulomyxa filosa TaxID=46433 RepID=X6NF91_RETFI|nr:hypothetical protein RFI_12159 [Reticulomyxa filosa]|eukprot:ETO24985.1 hypothetical protein RFI_12159 [Reticulomyxa filosa]